MKNALVYMLWPAFLLLVLYKIVILGGNSIMSGW